MQVTFRSCGEGAGFLAHTVRSRASSAETRLALTEADRGRKLRSVGGQSPAPQGRRATHPSSKGKIDRIFGNGGRAQGSGLTGELSEFSLAPRPRKVWES